MSDADLVFLPWVRRGAAAALLDPDKFTSDQPGLASARASVTVNDGPSPSVPVTVMGPGHVTGLDRRQVVRTDPAPGSRTFEPNYFPLVELDEPSLSWLFTPAGAGAQDRLRPWLCLVVVRLQDGVRLDPPTSGLLPVLRISGPADAAAELPDLADSWAWAHGQVTSEVGVSLENQLADNPERTVSRLLCSRILQPDTEYLACVVPTFELGCKAGLGQEITADDEAHLEPAWKSSAHAVELPVYYSWPFATGAGGDFQSLAMLLRARPLPPGIGIQPVDVGESGLSADIPAGTTVSLAGALQPVGANEGGWSTAALQAAWEKTLRPILNAPAAVVATEDPLLAPPLYGAAQAKVIELDVGSPSRWFEQLNLAPWHRAVAHLGTRVVQEQQDALMASAWDQAAQLAKVNQLLPSDAVRLAGGVEPPLPLHLTDGCRRWAAGARARTTQDAPARRRSGQRARQHRAGDLGILHRATSRRPAARCAEPAGAARRNDTPPAHDRGAAKASAFAGDGPPTGPHHRSGHARTRCSRTDQQRVLDRGNGCCRGDRTQATVLQVRAAG